MTQIVTALFENYDDAYEAVRRIEAAGISYRDISIVSNARDKRHVVHLGTTDDASKGASTGLGIGAALGGGAGLLAGLGMVSIPGLGPMVAAGWLAAAAAGAAAGASAGGIVGALTAAGLSDEDAQVYAEGLGRGGTIVTARLAEEQQANARSILSQCNAAEIHATGHVSRDALSADLSDASNASKATSASGKSDDPSLIASDRVRGTQVYDRNGKHIGAVEQLMIDKVSGQVAYVVMSFGGFLGAGNDTEKLPWDALEYDVHLGGYRTGILEDQVRGGRA